MDLAAYTAAGLYDAADPRAAERVELLEFLESEGCSLEEMQLAHARGRLYALAGDRRIRPLVGLLSLRDAAARLEAEPSLLARAWRTLGLPDNGVDAPLLAEHDVEMLGTFLTVRDFLGEDTALGVARVVGAAVARITEAESSAMRIGMQGVIDLGVTDSEVITAKAFATVTQLVPRIGQMLDAVHRQHLEATRVHFEDVDSVRVGSQVTFRCGIGFADLSGFTRLSQELGFQQLASVLSDFEATATDTVHARGGRVVKFLGDAVMWVSAQADDLARIASDLVTHPRAVYAGVDVRAGIAYGELLAQEGDYFGQPVNLASRLVAVAEPGQVLASPGLVEHLPAAAWLAVPGQPTALRGFDDPVTPYALTPA